MEEKFRVQLSFWNTEHSSVVETALKAAGFDPGHVEDWREDEGGEDPPEDWPKVFMWLDFPFLGEIEIVKTIAASRSPMLIAFGGKPEQTLGIHFHISGLGDPYPTPAIDEGWLGVEEVTSSAVVG